MLAVPTGVELLTCAIQLILIPFVFIYFVHLFIFQKVCEMRLITDGYS